MQRSRGSQGSQITSTMPLVVFKSRKELFLFPKKVEMEVTDCFQPPVQILKSCRSNLCETIPRNSTAAPGEAPGVHTDGCEAREAGSSVGVVRHESGCGKQWAWGPNMPMHTPSLGQFSFNRQCSCSIAQWAWFSFPRGRRAGDHRGHGGESHQEAAGRTPPRCPPSPPPVCPRWRMAPTLPCLRRGQGRGRGQGTTLRGGSDAMWSWGGSGCGSGGGQRLPHRSLSHHAPCHETDLSTIANWSKSFIFFQSFFFHWNSCRNLFSVGKLPILFLIHNPCVLLLVSMPRYPSGAKGRARLAKEAF